MALNSDGRALSVDRAVGAGGTAGVKLGLIPGAGGTRFRDWRVAKAARVCVWRSGQAQEALAAGIVDRIIDGDLRAGSGGVRTRIAVKPIRRSNDKRSQCDRRSFPPQRSGKMAGQAAPLAAIDAVEAASSLPEG